MLIFFYKILQHPKINPGSAPDAQNENEINIQSKHTINLAATFDTVKLQFTHRESTNLDNIMTGRLFENNVKRNVLSIQVKQIHFYKEFTDDRFWKALTMRIRVPVKKARLKKEWKTTMPRLTMQQITSTREIL